MNALTVAGKNITQANWRDAIFGYTGMIDVSARGNGRSTWRQGSWMGKSFDTFAPIGPAIINATAPTTPIPQRRIVRLMALLKVDTGTLQGSKRCASLTVLCWGNDVGNQFIELIPDMLGLALERPDLEAEGEGAAAGGRELELLTVVVVREVLDRDEEV